MNLKTIPLALAAVTITGCAGIQTAQKTITENRKEATTTFSSSSMISKEERVTLHDRPFMPVRTVTERNRGDWLKEIDKITLEATAKTIPVSQVMGILSARGINIVSDLPLNDYHYAGSITSMDAYNMLKIVLSTTGLDFEVNDERRIVYIKPLASRSWFFNVGRRSASFSASGDSGGMGSAPMMTGSLGGSGPGGMGGGGNTLSTGMGGSMGGAMGGLEGGGSVSVQTQAGFWQSLESEIKSRLTVMVPANRTQSSEEGEKEKDQALNLNSPLPPPIPGMPGSPMGVTGMNQTQGVNPVGEEAKAPNAGVSAYTTRRVGNYTINQDTGAVTVQAPAWMLEELDAYFKRVRDMNNAEITFTGQMVLVSDRDMNSAGLDISGFTSWVSKKYMGIISNNALGGVTVSFPEMGENQLPRVNASNMPVSGPILGIRSTGIDGLQLFNAYLAEQGGYSVVQKPIISTTSGVPAEFKKTTTRYFNTVSQDVASSTTSTAVGTQNQLNSVDLGTILRVNPLLDMSTGLVRTQLSLSQVMSSGTQQVPQTISVGNSAQTYISEIPILTRLSYSGEILLKDGDLIIVGGQKEDIDSLTENGLPDPRGGVGTLGGLLGTIKASKESSTYYFAMVVRINKRQ